MGAKLRRLGTFAVRVAITALVFALLFTRVDRGALASSFARLSPATVLLSLAIIALGLCIAVVRWRTLLRAYGAATPPSWPASARWVLVAIFYNLLPGSVGGDVYRGYATRHAFADGAATRSLAVVFVERVFGLAGLFILAALATLVSPSADRRVLLIAVLGLGCAVGAVTVVTCGPALQRFVPVFLRKLVGSLPRIERPSMFMLALPLSVLTHVCAALAGHVVLASLSVQTTLASSLVFFPLGSLAAYFPLTVAGAGARDGALAYLFLSVGVARADTLTTSLTLLGATLFFAALGGLLQLLSRTPIEAPAQTRS